MELRGEGVLRSRLVEVCDGGGTVVHACGVGSPDKLSAPAGEQFRTVTRNWSASATRALR
ncbi:hypothetical protein BGL_1c17540 [Burkholderia plantarii]|uniref:Uncharacterized protein n=1 Tax=Burkholderia plantarii TaxID=41899 RepID=A0A0B6RSA1_BURPL|nr:hypothetical protein BGL_1c17540 [Burkholderia plantarii]